MINIIARSYDDTSGVLCQYSAIRIPAAQAAIVRVRIVATGTVYGAGVRTAAGNGRLRRGSDTLQFLSHELSVRAGDLRAKRGGAGYLLCA